MAEGMDVQAAVDLPDVPEGPQVTTGDAIAPEGPSLASPNAGDNGKLDAVMPNASGKRVRDDDDDDDDDDSAAQDGYDQSEESSPPRKRARTSLSADGEVGEDLKASADADEDDPTVDSMKSSAPGGKDSTSARNKSSPPVLNPPSVRTSFAPPAAAAPAGLRTSFGVTAQAQGKVGNIEFEMHNALTNDERNQLIATVRDLGSLDVAPLFKRKLKWTVSPLVPEYLVGNTWREICEAAIDKWCQAFVAQNQDHIAQISLAPSLLKTGFERRLQDCETALPLNFKRTCETILIRPDANGSRLRQYGQAFKPNLKRLAKRQALKEMHAAKEAEDPSNSSTPLNSDENLASDQPANLVPPKAGESSVGKEQSGENGPEDTQDEAEMEDGEINSGDVSGVDMEIDEDVPPVSQAELDRRHRYFPGTPDDAIFCLTCAHLGHPTQNCPELICQFCQGDHFKYQCPTRERCAKCKQLGHTKASCHEKLAVAPGEAAVECAICEGHDHTEINCIQLYQIYRPEPGKVKKVQQIPAHCYVCGTAGHYGGDCAMADAGIPPTKMWCIATASLYIDPSSDDIALALQNALPPPPEVLRPNIPGRSMRPRTHIVYEESDGEGELPHPLAGGPQGLKRAKINSKKPKTAPVINIASNFSFGSATAPSNPPQTQQQQRKRQPKRQKGPEQHQNNGKRPGTDALPGNKPSRPRNTAQPPAPVNFTGVRTSQPPPSQSRGGGRGGRGGGGAGRGGGGFTALNAKSRPRRGKGGGRGGGGQN